LQIRSKSGEKRFQYERVLKYIFLKGTWPTAAEPQLRRLVTGFLLWRPGFELRSGYVGIVLDKVGLVFSECFGFSCHSFHRLLHTHHHHHHHHLSSGAGTTDKIVADVPSGLNLIPPQETTLGGKHSFYSTVKNWVVRFGTVHLNTVYEECSGRPYQVTIPKNVDAIHSMMLDD
jgi:hypothetical protein